ncbi:MAG: hypothetical protein L0229_27740 [Blastocatellia bacterium]|nr:hypothetical protein [Blastocatellia bacterium]
MSDDMQKLRANLKVVEQSCSICNLGFNLAEEVYQCPTCGGYHHVHCWESAGRCPAGSGQAVGEGSGEGAGPSASYVPGGEGPLWADESRVEGSGESMPPPLGGSDAEAGGGASGQGSPDKYGEWAAAWGGEEKPSQSGGGPQPPVTEAIGQSEQPQVPGPGERRCPTCAEIIKTEALKCRFCGHIFDSALRAQQYQSPQEYQRINKNANIALTLSIVGLFCWCILEPIAFFMATKVRRELDENPEYEIQGGARSKATAALIIAIIIGILGIIGSIINLSQMR